MILAHFSYTMASSLLNITGEEGDGAMNAYGSEIMVEESGPDKAMETKVSFHTFGCPNVFVTVIILGPLLISNINHYLSILS